MRWACDTASRARPQTCSRSALFLLEYRIEVAFTAEQARFSIFKTDGQVFTDEVALRALVAKACT